VNEIEPEEAAKKTRKIEIKVGLELDSKEELKIGEKDKTDIIRSSFQSQSCSKKRTSIQNKFT